MIHSITCVDLIWTDFIRNHSDICLTNSRVRQCSAPWRVSWPQCARRKNPLLSSFSTPSNKRWRCLRSWKPGRWVFVHGPKILNDAFWQHMDFLFCLAAGGHAGGDQSAGAGTGGEESEGQRAGERKDSGIPKKQISESEGRRREEILLLFQRQITVSSLNGLRIGFYPCHWELMLPHVLSSESTSQMFTDLTYEYICIYSRWMYSNSNITLLSFLY